jgi:hypothetical protein
MNVTYLTFVEKLARQSFYSDISQLFKSVSLPGALRIPPSPLSVTRCNFSQIGFCCSLECPEILDSWPKYLERRRPVLRFTDMPGYFCCNLANPANQGTLCSAPFFT